MSMTPEQFNKFQEDTKKHLEDTVAIAIEKNVNGKIRDLATKVNDYIKEDMDWKIKDSEWKKKAQPTITMGSNAINWWNMTKWLISTVVLFSGVALAIQALKELILKR